MVEHIIRKATFAGMKVSGSLLTQSVPGPFEVEVRPNQTKKGYTAVLLPTRQRFGSINTKKIDDAQAQVAGLFEKVVNDWEDVK